MTELGGGIAPTSDVPDLPEMPTAAPEGARRSRRRRAALGVAVVALLGATTVTTVLALGGSGHGGAKTPKAAVLKLVASIEDEDILGVLDAIDPAERDTLQAAVTDLDTEAKRLQLLDRTFSLSGVAGADILVQGLVLETEEIDPDLAVVRATAGSVHNSFDKATFPLGTTIGDVGDGTFRTTIDLSEAEPQLIVATVKRGGGWYASVSYTIAEYARRAAGVELSEPGAAVRPEGFSSPQEAAQALLDRLVALDVRGAVATAAPGEGDALARYAPLFLAGVAEHASFLRGDGLTLSLHDVTWDVHEEGDRAVASLSSYALDGTLPTSWASDRAYQGGPPFDPTLPTALVLPEENVYILIPAGAPVPDLIDDTMPRQPADELNVAEINFAFVTGNRVQPQWSSGPAPDPSVPSPFMITRSDGCTTLTGAAVDVYWSSVAWYFSDQPTQTEDSVQICDRSMPVGFWFFTLGESAIVSPPHLALVRDHGRWYVSPLGTVLTTVVDELRAVDAGDLGIDSPLAFWLYSYTRESLESALDGESRDDMSDACVPIAEFDGDGAFTRIKDDALPADVRACVQYEEDGWFSYDAGNTDTECADESGCSDTTLPGPATTPWRTLPPVFGSDVPDYTDETDLVPFDSGESDGPTTGTTVP